MKPGRRQHSLRFLRHGLLLLVAMVVISAGFLAVMPSAHACLHADSHQPDHHCWLTQYLDQPGMLLADGVPQLLPGCELIFRAVPVDRFTLPFAFTESFPPRGPPAPASALA